MRYLIVLILQVLVFFPLASYAAPHKAATAKAPEETRALKAYGNIPLYFIKNTGQVDRRVRYYEKGAGHATFFTEDGLVLALTKREKTAVKTNGHDLDRDIRTRGSRKFSTEALRLSFIGARKDALITANEKIPGRVNYFIGSDRSRWHSDIPTFGAVTYENIYKNIDIKFYGTGRNIEHDIIVHPGADPSVVRFRYEGVKGLELTPGGRLNVRLTGGDIIEDRPIVYQVINGIRKAVKGSYRVLKEEDGGFAYGYTVASYDRTKDLVIDPVLVYSTYLGGSGYDVGYDITVDKTGAVYITGSTSSQDFPLVGPVQYAFGGGNEDGFITKINPAGTAIVYSTYFGGMGNEVSRAIAVDDTGAVYVAGDTGSIVNFPLVNPIQGTFGGSLFDAFLLKLSPDGSAIVYSTYLGGSGIEYGYGLDIDSANNAYLTGSTSSPDFPTVNPIQIRTPDYYNYGFVTKINSRGSAIIYSTCVGGSGNDFAYAIDVDKSGAAYITGIAYSTDFPLVNPIQGLKGGGSMDAFVTKINPAGTAYVYSTYLGGSGGEWAFSVAVDNLGAAYITGEVMSPDFPTVNPIQGYTGYDDAFVTKINPAGSAVVYSTYLGGSSGDKYFDIAIDSTGAAYVTGWSASSTDYPIVAPLQGTYGGGASDITVAKINPTGSALVFSTFLGGSGNEPGRGIAVDSSGAIYITGESNSFDLPLANPIQGFPAGGLDAFISKITIPSVTLTINIGNILVARGSTLGYNVTATNTTAVEQCFQYWENLTIPGGSTYPVAGELFGPVSLCLAPGATQTTHLAHGVPLTTPLGTYAMNAYVGAYGSPARHVVVSEYHFNFDVTVFGPITGIPATSWQVLE